MMRLPFPFSICVLLIFSMCITSGYGTSDDDARSLISEIHKPVEIHRPADELPDGLYCFHKGKVSKLANGITYKYTPNVGREVVVPCPPVPVVEIAKLGGVILSFVSSFNVASGALQSPPEWYRIMMWMGAAALGFTIAATNYIIG